MKAENQGKPGYSGLTRIIRATGYSVKGLKAAFIHEAAIRQELILIIFCSPFVLFIDFSVVEKVILIGVLFLILIVELINSAIEAVVDRIGTEFHDLSGRAKDIGSSAVFVTLILAFLTWSMIIMFHFVR